jgi:hypothetical protein
MNRKPRIANARRWIGALCVPYIRPLAMALVMASALAPTGFMARAQQQVADAPGKPEKAKDEKGGDEALDKAGTIVSQPARDVGIAKTKIDPVLLAAVQQPYGRAGNGRCPAITAALARLNGALGPDFDANTKENENTAEKLALAGGAFLVNSLIPFRGVVREISGAAPQERRKAAAISAGTARRGYLRGIASAKGCKLPAVKAPPLQ